MFELVSDFFSVLGFFGLIEVLLFGNWDLIDSMLINIWMLIFDSYWVLDWLRTSKDFEGKDSLDIFKMLLKALIVPGQMLDDLVVLKNHLLNVNDGLLVECFL